MRLFSAFKIVSRDDESEQGSGSDCSTAYYPLYLGSGASQLPSIGYPSSQTSASSHRKVPTSALVIDRKFSGSHDPRQHKFRLQELAKELNIPLNSHLRQINVRQDAPAYCTSADKSAAESLLNKRRLTDPEYKAPTGVVKLTMSKSKIATFSEMELNRALEATVTEGGSLGLVDALLNMGASADVPKTANTSIWKRVTKQTQTNQRCKLLQIAVRSGSLEMVELLAAHAGQENLDESLAIAIKQGDARKVRVLLQYQANCEDAHDEFLQSVRLDALDVVESLLSASALPCVPCRAAGLCKAVQNRSQGMTNSLIAAGADTSFGNGQAIMHAVTTSNYGAALAIASSQNPPTPSQLDRAASKALELDIILAEICLCGGAKGEETETSLQAAVQKRDFDVVSILLEYSVSLDKDSGKALCLAIEQESVSIFYAMLSCPMSLNTLGNALASASYAQILGLDFARSLMEKGASVDYDNAKPIVTAIQNGRNTILRTLINQPPSKKSLNIALMASLRLSHKNRMEALSIILPAEPHQKALDDALILLVNEPKADHLAINALLGAHASPDAQNGEPIVRAACKRDVRILSILSAHVVSPKSAYTRAAAALAKDVTWRQLEGMQMLQRLLEYGADPSVLKSNLVESAVSVDMAGLSFLSTWIDCDEVYTTAFTALLESEDKWLQPSSLGVVELLLQKGASGVPVDDALVQAIEAYLEGHGQYRLVEVLLEFKADVNFDRGLVLKLAIRAGENRLLNTLCRFEPSAENLSKALCETFVSDHADLLVLDMINTLADHTRLDINTAPEGVNLPIFLALTHYPTSGRLLRGLCEIGCDTNALIRVKLFGDEDKVSVLMWACCQVGEGYITLEIISFLIRHGADVHVASNISQSTSLHLAAYHNRPDIVMELLRHGADSSVLDALGESALSLAVQNADEDTARVLLEANPAPPRNDGSLHTAAQICSPYIISILIQAGHDPNYSSPRHDNLTPLGVLARCDSCTVQEIELCIDALNESNLDPFKQRHGKTCLYIAMESDDPLPVTLAIAARFPHPYLLDKRNQFHHEGSVYSPTMYLLKGPFEGRGDAVNDLVEILRAQGGEDVFYSTNTTKDQPPGYCGAPPHINRAQAQRDKRREQLEHERDLSAQRRENLDLEHHQRLAYSEEEAEQSLTIMDLKSEKERTHYHRDTTAKLERQGKIAKQDHSHKSQMNTLENKHRRLQNKHSRAELAARAHFADHMQALEDKDKQAHVSQQRAMFKHRTKYASRMVDVNKRAGQNDLDYRGQRYKMEDKAVEKRVQNESFRTLVRDEAEERALSRKKGISNPRLLDQKAIQQRRLKK